MDYKKILEQSEYKFLNENPLLKDKLIMLVVGGSHAYGMNNENSDLDIRGICKTPIDALLGFSDFEQYIDNNTDTTIYSFNKIVKLLLNTNPNTIEMLGCKPEHYLYLSPIGQQLIDNKNMFLSQRAIKSFGAYALGQLARAQNALARDSFEQKEKEQHILNSVKSAIYSLNDRYKEMPEGALSLYIDKSENEELDEEIFINVDLKQYPLRDYKNVLMEFNNIVKCYGKLNHRNSKKDILHLNKHIAHLFRLYMMGIDILEKQEVNTYRSVEHDFLMDLRNGKYVINGDYSFITDLLKPYQDRFDYASKHTILPKEPNYKEIEEFVIDINLTTVVEELLI